MPTDTKQPTAKPAATAVAEPATKKKRDRSPSYPAVNLKEALGFADKLYRTEGKHKAHMAVALKHWGYSAKSSSGLLAAAALKKFGLSVEDGSGDSREIGLSDLALTIILDETPNSKERLAALQQAALKPPIHAQFWQKYRNNLPSDASLKMTLVKDMGFTEAAALAFIAEYKETLEFAKLNSGAIISAGSGDKTPADDSQEDETPDLGGLGRENSMPTAEAPAAPLAGMKPLPSPGANQQRNIQLPLLDGTWAMISAAFPMTEDSWKQMLAVLNAMKPGLVK